jgi:hypothetical protein
MSVAAVRAMQGFHFCYYHARHHLPPRVRGKRKIRLSALESAQSLQIALTQMAQALLDDELEPAKAYALVQLMHLSVRAIEMKQCLVARNLNELPASMSHLIEQPQPEVQSDAIPAPANSDVFASSPDPVIVPKKKPPMTYKEFIPWRDILLQGESHPQYQEACGKQEEYMEQFENLLTTDSA